MPKALNWHSNLRVDVEDLDHGTTVYARESVKLNQAKELNDRQARIVRGFRVELANQTSYPGQLTLHGGIAYDYDGQILLNEDQYSISRTVNLEGAGNDFFIEIEFTESESDVDSRGFWDPTVDRGFDVSGDELPDGQEFNNNVATRLTPDWLIVDPISTTGFDRDTNPDSNRVPIIHVKTNAGTNAIETPAAGAFSTEKAATVLLDEVTGIGVKTIRVQNPQLLPPAGANNLILGVGTGTPETVNIVSINRETGVLSINKPAATTHYAGEIVRGTGASALDIVVEVDYGRYRRNELAVANRYDYRDKLFQGDEIHGDILSRGHSSTTAKSDVNLQSLKDHIDFLSAQVQELKWGIPDPYTSMVDASRTPPGLSVTFPTTPRYYDRAGGVAPAKSVSVTVGDGLTSFGDFNAGDETSIQAAHDNLPAAGGVIVIKEGVYVLANNVNITKSVTIIGNTNAIIRVNGGGFDINCVGGEFIDFRDLYMERQGVSIIGVSITTVPSSFRMSNCYFYNLIFECNDVMNYAWNYINKCTWVADDAALLAAPLIFVNNVLGALSGVWEDCYMANAIATGVGGSCVDARIGATGTYDLKFVKCVFEDRAANTSIVRLGTAPDNCTFDKCTFSSAVTNNLCIDVIGGGSSKNVSIVDCLSKNSSPIVSMDNVRNFYIKGVTVDHISAVIGAPAITIINSNYGTIEGCSMSTSGGVPIISLDTVTYTQIKNIKGVAPTSSVIDATSCTFLGIHDCTCPMTGTGNFVTLDTVSNTDITNCNVTAINGYFVDMTACYRIKVEGNTMSTTLNSLMTLLNSEQIVFNDCIGTLTSSGVSLVESAIYITNTAGVIEDILISNCKFTAGNDKAVGIILDVNVGSGFEGVSIVNNFFEQFEVGVALLNTTIGEYKNINISNNVFQDIGSTSLEALYQKVGIFQNGNGDCRRFSITGNTFTNINPNNTNVIPGFNGRSAIYFKTDNTYTFDFGVISDNLITNVGSLTSPTTDTVAIWLAHMTKTLVSDNVINSVFGNTNPGGILFGSGTVSTSNVKITGNYISSVISDAGASGAFGVKFFESSRVEIDGNTFDAIGRNAAGEDSYCIAYVDPTKDLSQCVISNNRGTGTATGDRYFVFISGGDITNLQVDENKTTIGTSWFAGAFIYSGIGSIKYVSVKNNTFGYGGDGTSTLGHGIYIISSVVSSYISISGNHVNESSASAGGAYGIYVSSTGVGLGEELSILNNHVISEVTSADGIYVGRMTNVSIIGNHVRAANGGAGENIRVFDSIPGSMSRIMISANSCMGTTTSTVNIDVSTLTTAIGNLVSENAVENALPGAINSGAGTVLGTNYQIN